MPKENKKKKLLCVKDLRYAEYYEMQQVFDELYAKSTNGEVFTKLMDLILSKENILLAYRSIKTNKGSLTAGTDKLTINDIGILSPEEMVEKFRFIIRGRKQGYQPKPVRRKEIPKPNGKTRPLGIPCIWDRIIQQCIKQVLEPICEAKFSDNSHGFRPQRSVEHAIQQTYRLLQNSNLHYVIEFDIKGFFDNVNHTKLMRQIWTLGIRDKQLLWIIKQILKAPILMENGDMVKPNKGTPQGGIISPLLANIVLNELDRWIEGQWQYHPVTEKYSSGVNASGSKILSNGYAAMKSITTLKRMFIVRYADDFRIFCGNLSDAEKTMYAVTKWLQDRLRLEVSPEKTRIVNTKEKYMEFLGFKIKVMPKGNKMVVKSHISDKQLEEIRKKLKAQIKRVAHPEHEKGQYFELRLYNSMVMGIHNYYQIATMVNIDLNRLQWHTQRILLNRTSGQRGIGISRTGRELTPFERKRYGKSRMLRFLKSINEPIYPIAFVSHKNPRAKKRSLCIYTAEGRKEIHDNLIIDTRILWEMKHTPIYNCNVEYADNRISLYSAQKGKCAITGIEFQSSDEIHCHHKKPKKTGGTDKYRNLILVLDTVHRLIHATSEEVIEYYMQLLKLDSKQIGKLNKLRELSNLKAIALKE